MQRPLQAFVILALLLSASGLHASVVRVVKNSGRWQLLVDDKPFRIKGVGCNQATGEKGEDYLRMAHEMGANTVRTWGGAPRSYLDQAASHNLMVNLGVWLNAGRNGAADYTNAEYRRQLKTEILSYVDEMKDHPALLSWNIGNETFRFTEHAEGRAALGAFLQNVVEAVHQHDPDHPVLFASSAASDLPYLKKYVPALDIIGANVYGGLGPVLRWMDENPYDKPLVVTEFGPLGAWDSSKDKNGLPFDPADQLKAANYSTLWNQILAAKSRCLGGFAFVLGEQRNQDSYTWFNVNLGDKKRASYWTLYQLYTGKRPPVLPPKILSIHLEPEQEVRAGESLLVRSSAESSDGNLLDYSYFITDIVSDPLIVTPATFYPIQQRLLGPGIARLRVPNDPGEYRVYITATDSRGNIAVANRSLRVKS